MNMLSSLAHAVCMYQELTRQTNRVHVVLCHGINPNLRLYDLQRDMFVSLTVHSSPSSSSRPPALMVTGDSGLSRSTTSNLCPCIGQILFNSKVSLSV